MQVRRVVDQSGQLQTQARSSDQEEWADSSAGDAFGYVSPFRPEWEAERARSLGAVPGDVVLPLQPLSFRDFMLFEKHFIGAGRGWVHRFRPRLARSADAFETVTRRTFPPYRAPKFFFTTQMYYMSNAQTFVPSGTDVAFPPYSKALDWELELGFVLKAPLVDATPEEAEQAIGAFVVLNDLSARDVQVDESNSGFGPQKAKHFASSMSAIAVTADEVLPHWKSLTASVTLNGEVVSRPSPATAHWTLGEMLAHASAGEQLQPGEFFGTGTWLGGSGMEIQRWLKPGDTIRLDIDGVGHVEHRIVGSA